MPTPTSRRERPAKAALSREAIIAETVRIMRSEGLEKATMRRVAQALDTGPASLYVYVSSTAELHAAVLDELMGQLTASTDGTWRERLDRLLGDYLDILVTHPGLARSALTLRPSGPNTIALFDRVLGLLLEGGVPTERAAWGVDLLLQQAIAAAAEHSAATPDPADASHHARQDALQRAVHEATPSEAPHVAAHAATILSGTPAERRAWAVDVLVNGVATTPVPTHP